MIRLNLDKETFKGEAGRNVGREGGVVRKHFLLSLRSKE
jgi:hypothetical protein